MNKDTIITALRNFVHKFLSPTQEQRDMVTAVYAAVCTVLGKDRCYQIGSYPRYTAIRPPHDLDILFSADKWPGHEPDASAILQAVQRRLQTELVPPKGLTSQIVLQTHSISISFRRNGEEVFAVDVVPGWTTGTSNEFGDDIYWVPEIILRGHRGRLRTYKRLLEMGGHVDYIRSDPKGYIKVAAAVNTLNEDFRRTVKLVKRWKVWAKSLDESFKMKSFHIEQIITAYFRESTDIDILSASIRFFEELPQWIAQAQIRDRADGDRFIDAYVNDLTASERTAILRARDLVLARIRSGAEFDAERLFEAEHRAQAASATSTPTSGAPAVLTERSKVQPRPPFASEE
jgi:hypothetical protein